MIVADLERILEDEVVRTCLVSDQALNKTVQDSIEACRVMVETGQKRRALVWAAAIHKLLDEHAAQRRVRSAEVRERTLAIGSRNIRRRRATAADVLLLGLWELAPLCPERVEEVLDLLEAQSR